MSRKALPRVLGGRRLYAPSGLGQVLYFDAFFGDGENAPYVPVVVTGRTTGDKYPLTSIEATPLSGSSGAHTINLDGVTGGVYFTDGVDDEGAPDGCQYVGRTAGGDTCFITIHEGAGFHTFNDLSDLATKRAADHAVDDSLSYKYALRFDRYDGSGGEMVGQRYTTVNLNQQPTYPGEPWIDFSFDGGECWQQGCEYEPWPTIVDGLESGAAGGMNFKWLNFVGLKASPGNNQYFPNTENIVSITKGNPTIVTIPSQSFDKVGYEGNKIEFKSLSGDWSVLNSIVYRLSQDSPNSTDYYVDVDTSSLPDYVQGTHGGTFEGYTSTVGGALIGVGTGGGASVVRWTECAFFNRAEEEDEAYWPTLYDIDGPFTWIVMDNCIADGVTYGARGVHMNKLFYNTIIRNSRHDIMAIFTARPQSAVWLDAEMYGKYAVDAVSDGGAGNPAYIDLTNVSDWDEMEVGDSFAYYGDTNSNFLGQNNLSGTTQTTNQCTRQNSAYFVMDKPQSKRITLGECRQRPLTTIDMAADIDISGGAGNHYIDITGHPFTDDEIRLHAKNGATLDSAIPSLTTVYIVNEETDRFQISLTEGGAPLDFNSDGSGPVGLFQTNGVSPEDRREIDVDDAIGWLGANAPNGDGFVYPMRKQLWMANCFIQFKPRDHGYARVHADLWQGGSVNNVINQDTILWGVYALGCTGEGAGTQGYFGNGFEADGTLGELFALGCFLAETDLNAINVGFARDRKKSWMYGNMMRYPLGGGGNAAPSFGGAIAAPEGVTNAFGDAFTFTGKANANGEPGNAFARHTSDSSIEDVFEGEVAELTRNTLTFYGHPTAFEETVLYDTGSLAEVKAYVEAWAKPKPGFESYGIWNDPTRADLYPHWWQYFRDASLSIDDFDNAPPTTKLAHGIVTHKVSPGAIGVGESVWKSDAAQPCIDVFINSSNFMVVEAYGSGGTKDWSVVLSSYALSADEEVYLIWDFNIDTGGTGLKVTMRSMADGSALASGTDGTLGTLAPVSQGTYTLMADGLGGGVGYLYIDMEHRLDFTDADYVSTYLIDENGPKPPAWHLWAQRDLYGRTHFPDVMLFGCNMMGAKRNPEEQDENPVDLPILEYGGFCGDGGPFTKSGDGHVYSEITRDAFTTVPTPSTAICYARNSTGIEYDITVSGSFWGTLHVGFQVSATAPSASALVAGSGMVDKTAVWITGVQPGDTGTRTRGTLTGATATNDYNGFAVIELPDGTLGDVISLGAVTMPSYTLNWQDTTDDTNLVRTGEFFASAHTTDKMAVAIVVSPDDFGSGNMGQTIGLNSGNCFNWTRGSTGWNLELDRVGGGIATLNFNGLTFIDKHRYLLYACMDSSASGIGWVARVQDLDDLDNFQELTDTTNNYVVELNPANDSWRCVGGTGANDMVGRVGFVYWADVLVDIDTFKDELFEVIEGGGVGGEDKGWVKDPTALESSIGNAFALTVGADFQTGANQGSDGNGSAWDTVNGTFTTVTDGDILLEQA